MIGGSEAIERHLIIAEEVGSLIARHHAILVTGGMGGIMEAASRGAKNAGGLVIGILPGTTTGGANAYVDIPIVTGMNQARNVVIARTCDCAVAIDGKYGTLSEIAYCLMFAKPVVGIDTWDVSAPVVRVTSAEQAVQRALELIK